MKTLILKAKNKKQKYFSNFRNQVNILLSSSSSSSSASFDKEDNTYYFENKILNNRYIFIKYLSKGSFSNVWLIYDILEFNFKSAKIYFNKDYFDEFNNEIKMFNIINNKNNNIVNLTDIIQEDNVKIIIMELLGISLLDIINDISEKKIDMNINLIKEIFKQILTGYDGLHSNKIIHADIKPDNILFNIYPNNLKQIITFIDDLDIKSIYNQFVDDLIPKDFDDFQKNKKKNVKKKVKIKSIKAIKDYLSKHIESLTYEDDSNYDLDKLYSNNFKVKIIDFSNSEIENNIIKEDDVYVRYYRPIENILNLTFNLKSDIWAIGCVFYEIISGNYLFDINQKSNKNSHHLYQIFKTFEYQKYDKIIEKCNYYDNFFVNNKLKIEHNYEVLTLKEKLLQYSLLDINLLDILNFITLFFIYDPNLRPDTKILLLHDFLHNY